MAWVCIDFGTCNTAAAIEIDGSPHVVSYGNIQYFPTVACVLDDGTIEVCQNAEPLRRQYPETFKQEFKLQIGDNLDINSVTYTDIVTEILAFIKGCAEIENNGKQIENVVLTIPVIYTEKDIRKAVMREAALRAEFQEIEFIPEPEAAAYHYAEISEQKSSGLSLVYDLGGGTFDAALLDQNTSLLGHESGVKCGGHFFDMAIYKYISLEACDNDTPLKRQNKLEDYELCCRIKETLSVKQSATQIFSNGQRHTLTREKFDSLIRTYIDTTLQACDSLISNSGRKWTDINQVLLVGGSTAIPLVNKMLEKHLISHNATEVKIIRNTRGSKGEYNHRFATCIGGIAKKILPPPPPQEKIAKLCCGSREIELKFGDNNFGRGDDMDFRSDDSSMSRFHFTINVTRDSDNHLNYNITTRSKTQSTVINNIEALDTRYEPFSRTSIILNDGDTITAGKTRFFLKKPKTDQETIG